MAMKREVFLHGKPGCVQCNAAQRLMNKLDIDYTYIDVEEDTTAYEYIKGLGYTSLPVTLVLDPDASDHWSGYRDERIRALANG